MNYEAPFDLATLHKTWQEAARSLGERIALMRDAITKTARSPEFREARSKRRYRDAVAREREIGLAFVRAEAARVRAELGLPDHPFLSPGFPPFPAHAVCYACLMVRGAHDG